MFGEFSYDRASIAEIVRRAGVAQGTFYVYFPDKKAAFVELVRQLNHNLRRTLAESVADESDRLQIERLGFRTFFDYVSRHKALYRVVREAEFVDVATYRWHYRTLAEGYVEGIKAAQARGEITDAMSAETMAWTLMGIAEFAGGRWVLWEGQPPPDDVFEDLMTFITAALIPRAAAS